MAARRRVRRRDSDEEAAPTPAAVPKRPARKRPVDRDSGDRGLRAIVGNTGFQVDVSAAMRARDVARPSAEDEAAAERDLTIVRRHYVPPESDRD